MRLSVFGLRIDQVIILGFTANDCLTMRQSGRFLTLPYKIITRSLSLSMIPLVQIQLVRYFLRRFLALESK